MARVGSAAALALVAVAVACGRADRAVSISAACADPGCRPAIAGAQLAGPRLEGLDGKVVLVNYWATWCRPCLTEIPLLDAAYRRGREQGLVVVGVVVADEAPDDRVREIAGLRGATYPIVRGADEMRDQLGLGARWPTSRLYGPDGRLRRRWDGRAVTEPELDAELRALAAGAP